MLPWRLCCLLTLLPSSLGWPRCERQMAAKQPLTSRAALSFLEAFWGLHSKVLFVRAPHHHHHFIPPLAPTGSIATLNLLNCHLTPPASHRDRLSAAKSGCHAATQRNETPRLYPFSLRSTVAYLLGRRLFFFFFFPIGRAGPHRPTKPTNQPTNKPALHPSIPNPSQAPFLHDTRLVTGSLSAVESHLEDSCSVA